MRHALIKILARVHLVQVTPKIIDTISFKILRCTGVQSEFLEYSMGNEGRSRTWILLLQ